jgi:hypothetical protein
VSSHDRKNVYSLPPSAIQIRDSITGLALAKKAVTREAGLVACMVQLHLTSTWLPCDGVNTGAQGQTTCLDSQ